MWKDHELEFLRNCLAQWYENAPAHEDKETLAHVREVLDILTSLRVDVGEFVRMSLPPRNPRMLPYVPEQTSVKDKMINVATIALLKEAAEAAGEPLVSWEVAADALMLSHVCLKTRVISRFVENTMD